MLKNATIIEDHTSEDEVGINTIVTLYIPDEDCEETYQLVTSIRSSSLRDMVSIESPLGKAIRGKKVGETATVQVPMMLSSKRSTAMSGMRMTRSADTRILYEYAVKNGAEISFSAP